MKKIIACISLVFAMSAGVTALAADATYSDADNSVSIDATGYTTVLIEDAEGTILYVDQNDSGLLSAAKFLLKGTDKLAYGTYTVKMGGNGAATSSTFTVRPPQELVALDVTNKELATDGETYNYGFFGTVSAADCSYIAITVTKGEDTRTGYYDSPFVASGAGDVNAAVKITSVPSEYTVSVALTNVNE